MLKADRLGIAGRVLPVLAWTLTLAGCLQIGDPPKPAMAVHNQTDETLAIVVNGATFQEVPPHATGLLGLNGSAGECTEWRAIVETSDGVEVARTGPPVCDGDQWTITQAELDRARLNG